MFDDGDNDVKEERLSFRGEDRFRAGGITSFSRKCQYKIVLNAGYHTSASLSSAVQLIL